MTTSQVKHLIKLIALGSIVVVTPVCIMMLGFGLLETIFFTPILSSLAIFALLLIGEMRTSSHGPGGGGEAAMGMGYLAGFAAVICVISFVCYLVAKAIQHFFF